MKPIAQQILLSAVLSVGTINAAHADDWACEVLLCLSNPQGATAVAPCVAPIKKLWRELAKGRAFPTCFMGGGGNGGAHRFASGDYCPPEYLIPPTENNHYWNCSLRGAVTVTINGKPTTRVWWTGEISFTEMANDGVFEERPRPDFGGELQR